MPTQSEEPIKSGMPESDRLKHLPAFLAIAVLIFSARIASFLTSDHAHPALLYAWLALVAGVVTWAAHDEVSNR